MIWSLACGSYTVFAVEDGWFLRDPLQQFPDVDPRVWEGPDTTLVDGELRIPIGCFVVTDGHRTLLVDAGAGSDPTPLGDRAVTGRMPEALAMLGLRPADVGDVIHTHLHHDHSGGDLTPEGAPFFPEARVIVQQAELDHWRKAVGPAAERADALVSTLLAARRLEPISGEAEPAPGVAIVPTPGHTPGHQSVVVSSRGSRVVITGDVTHHPIQVAHPEWGIPFDADPDQARLTRRRLIEEWSGTGTVVAAGHYPKPGMGFIETVGDERLFVAAPTVQVA